uniref:Uncharacterized protein n=1 Tax=Globisporangium ultimum (strain ATCC 200006 / CBS 805.95 / DAOM BR144) TaxID=431595 RepID=K3WPD1_GLOUD
MSDFIDQLKAAILDIGLKSTPTLVYVDCDYLATDEFAILIETLMLRDLPFQFYSSADKAQVLGYDHQCRSAGGIHNSNKTGAGPEHLRPVSDPPEAPTPHRSAFRDNLKKCLYLALSFSF